MYFVTYFSTPYSSVYPRNRCVGRAFLLKISKVIKNSLCFTISQQHPFGLAMFSIKNHICKNILKDDMVDQFAVVEARKTPFC